jgi:hypothetical protein
VSVPVPPADPNAVRDFPSITWGAHQPLARVHRHEFGSLFFGNDQDGRWNPPEPGTYWGTCYMSTQALLRCSIAGHAEARLGPLCWSDGGSEFVEGGGQPVQRRGVDCELVVAAA